MAVLFMFAYFSFQQFGLIGTIRQWGAAFRTDSGFRCLFFLVLYTAMILLQTVLCRKYWSEPLIDPVGPWNIFDENGNLKNTVIENFLMFIPWSWLFWNLIYKVRKTKIKLAQTLFRSFELCFSFSLGIELCQLIFHLGTFQLSDLFFNTLGGVCGGGAYFVFSCISTTQK